MTTQLDQLEARVRGAVQDDPDNRTGQSPAKLYDFMKELLLIVSF